MKKQLILGAALAVLATPAFATRARLLALGESQANLTGSLYISDNRNVFLNAAYLNNYSDMAYFELGDNGSQTLGATTKFGDSDISQQAEGGVFMKAGSLNYGIYYGRESAYANEIRSYTRLFSESIHEDDQIDLFVAGEAGVKWGANLTYSKSEDDANNAEQDSMAVRGGVMGTNWEGFVNLSLSNKAELDATAGSDKDEFDGNLGYELGGNYDMNGIKLFGYWRHATWDQESNSAIAVPGASDGSAYQGKAEGTYNKFTIGAGRSEKISDRGTLFTKLAVDMTKRELDTDDDGKANLDDTIVPLVVGMEYDAESWLTLRGSITQNLYGKTNNDYDSSLTGLVSNAVLADRPDGKRTIRNSTNVNMGATLKFGELAIDGIVGTNNGAGSVSNNAGSFNAQKKGVLATDNLMSRVSMTYKF